MTKTDKVCWMAKNMGVLVRTSTFQFVLKTKKLEEKVPPEILDEFIEKEDQTGKGTSKDRATFLAERTGLRQKAYQRRINGLIRKRRVEKGLPAGGGNSGVDHSSPDDSSP